MSRLIDLDKLLEFPVRLNHYDKEHGDINFVYGIETVLEYAENLPIIDTAEIDLILKNYSGGQHMRSEQEIRDKITDLRNRIKSDSEVIEEMSNDSEQNNCTSDIICGFIDRVNENYGRIYLLSWVLGEVEQ